MSEYTQQADDAVENDQAEEECAVFLIVHSCVIMGRAGAPRVEAPTFLANCQR